MKIILDGNEMKTKEIAHDYLKKKLSLPEYYGENLDALWDILSTCDHEIEIELMNKDRLIDNLKKYGEDLIELLQDVEIENSKIYFKIR